MATLEAIAAELGVSRRTVVRLLESALEKLRAGLDPDLDLEHFVGEMTIECPFPQIASESDQHASRVEEPLPAAVLVRRRARHAVQLPRRFRRRNP